MKPREVEAREALWLARASIERVKPDGIGVSGRGEPVSWISARRMDEVADEALVENDLDAELIASVLGVAGNFQIARTSFRWMHLIPGGTGWASKATVIETNVNVNIELSPSAASVGAVTAARKLYLRHLLRIRVADDPALDLARAHDRAREKVWDTVGVMLRAHCRATHQPESQVIATHTGFVTTDRSPATFEMLPHLQVAQLFMMLTMALGPAASEAWDPGAGPGPLTVEGSG